MRKFLDIIRIIFVSPELLMIIVITILYVEFQSYFLMVGEKLLSNESWLKYIPTIPGMLLMFSVKYSWKILKPSGETNKILYEWKDYWRLKYRVIISIGICFLCTCLSFYNWIFIGDSSKALFALLTAISIVVALIVVGTLLLAAFRINELMSR